MTRLDSIREVEAVIVKLKAQMLINNYLRTDFTNFLTECDSFQKNIGSCSDREISKILRLLNETSIMVEGYDTYDFDALVKQAKNVRYASIGLPEIICNYGLKFLQVAALSLLLAAVSAALLFTFVSTAAPVIFCAFIAGAILGSLLELSLTDTDNFSAINKWCEQFFRPSDPPLIEKENTFRSEALAFFTTKDVEKTTYTPYDTAVLIRNTRCPI